MNIHQCLNKIKKMCMNKGNGVKKQQRWLYDYFASFICFQWYGIFNTVLTEVSNNSMDHFDVNRSSSSLLYYDASARKCAYCMLHIAVPNIRKSAKLRLLTCEHQSQQMNGNRMNLRHCSDKIQYISTTICSHHNHTSSIWNEIGKNSCK